MAGSLAHKNIQQHWAEDSFLRLFQLKGPFRRTGNLKPNLSLSIIQVILNRPQKLSLRTFDHKFLHDNIIVGTVKFTL